MFIYSIEFTKFEMVFNIVLGVLAILIGIVLIIFDKVLIKGIGIVKIKKQEGYKVEFFILRLIA